MNMTVAIFGGSKGLGSQLADSFVGRGFTVHKFSRTKTTNPWVVHHYCDVSSDSAIVSALLDADTIFDLVIYCCSVWLDSESGTVRQLQHFIDVGPLGFQRMLNVLERLKVIKMSGNIISIGSTASENFCQSSHPAYAISKKLQDCLVQQSQSKQDTALKITNITLGTLGDDFIKAQDVLAAIDLIMGLSQTSVLTNITLRSAVEYGNNW